MTTDNTSSKIEQKGVRERLLCKDCESKLSPYEKYADENLYGKNKRSTVNKINQSVTPDFRVFLYEFVGFDYGKMKIFLDSLLWRLIICTKIETPDYEPVVVEKLRNSLFMETPLEPDEFPCLVKTIMKAPGQILKGFIMSPQEKTNDGRVLLSILIDGFEYNYYMTQELPNDEVNAFLQKNGDLKFLGVLLSDMPDLIQQLKMGMGYLKDQLDQKKQKTPTNDETNQ